jgi:eukaryotic-like serine/threonine-protein kinase
MLEPGAHLGAYTIVRPLGAGGMGVVYLARHRHIGRDAAIKVLLPELTKNDDIVARFLTEARATAAIRHPGIVEILDCDIDSTGRAYIVMEYLRGESLANCLARARRSLSALPTVVSVGAQVASALSAAHERGIVHRDLKPDNLFLSTDGAARTPITIKILDFGIAKLVSSNNEGNQHKTRTGSMLGTPAYMSPEQARDASSIDDRADIYALGCILFEMVAGRPPFVRPGAGEVMIAHVIEAPPRLSSLVPEVEPSLESLVSQMLEKDPAARPQTMSEVQSRLESLVTGRPAPLMTAIMPTVDASQPHIVISTPPPGSGGGQQTSPLFGSTARFPDAAAPSPVSEVTSPSGRVVPGGTLVMPAAGSPTATHSTTMSDSAAEVGSGATKTLSSRRRPAVVGAAVAGVGLVVVALAMLLKPGPNGGTTSATVVPTTVPTATTPTPTNPAVENPTPTETAPKAEPTKAVEAPKEEPKVEIPARPVVVEVSSEPSGAEVWLPSDTEARGHTPFKVALDPKADPTHVVLKARGYADKGIDIDPGKPEPMSVKLDRNAPREHAKKKPSEPGEKKPPKDDYRRMGD